MARHNGPRPTVVFLCTANSARSQIAEALARSLVGESLSVFSAGTHPADHVHPLALKAIQEAELPAPEAHPKSVDELPCDSFDWVITVCDDANEHCPILPGKGRRLHWSIPDPAAVEGPEHTRYEAFLAAMADLRCRITEWLQEQGSDGA